MKLQAITSFSVHIVYFLLFLLPLFVIPLGKSPYEVPKVVLAQGSIDLLLIVFLLNKTRQKIRFNPIHRLLILCIFVISLIHILLHPSTQMFFGNIFRLQGTLLFWHLLLFSLLVPFVPFHLNRKLPLLTIVFLTLAAFLLGPNVNGRFYATLGEPNALAAQMIFLWPLILYATPQQPRLKNIQVLGIILAIIVIFLSQSQSGLIALTVQFFLLLIWKLNKKWLILAYCITLLLLVTSFFVPFLMKKTQYDNRSDIWATAFHAGFSNPIIGSGFGSIQQQISHAALFMDSTNNTKLTVVDSSHNIFLDWWIQAGIIGVVFLISLILITGFSLAEKNAIYLACFLGVITMLSFNPASVTTLLDFWWLIGLSAKKDFT